MTSGLHIDRLLFFLAVYRLNLDLITLQKKNDAEK